MIFKKQVFRADKKVNPLIGIILFFISIFLFIITIPLGFIYGLFYKFSKKGIVGIGEYLLNIAISIDQLGNVTMQHLLNLLWIKKNGYKFGNRDETISSALGRNNKLDTLSYFGKTIDKFLNYIDKNHSLNSIDYYIEPSADIIDKLAWIYVINQRVLMLGSQDHPYYFFPGGKKKKGTSDAMTLQKEIADALQIELDITTFKFIGIFEAEAEEYKPGILTRTTAYSASFSGIPTTFTETDQIVWLQYNDRDKVSEVDKLIFDFLKKSGQLA